MTGCTDCRDVARSRKALAERGGQQEKATAGRRDKRGSPVDPQAIGIAWVSACRSVGTRAEPCILTNAIKGFFGTVHVLDCWEARP
jgi:hypothetical protein